MGKVTKINDHIPKEKSVAKELIISHTLGYLHGNMGMYIDSYEDVLTNAKYICLYLNIFGKKIDRTQEGALTSLCDGYEIRRHLGKFAIFLPGESEPCYTTPSHLSEEFVYNELQKMALTFFEDTDNFRESVRNRFNRVRDEIKTADADYDQEKSDSIKIDILRLVLGAFRKGYRDESVIDEALEITS